MSSMAAGASGKTAVTNVRVFDGQGLRPPGTVVIEGHRIGEGPIGTGGAEVIDGAGGVLLPGLIDAHVHVRDEDTLRRITVDNPRRFLAFVPKKA